MLIFRGFAALRMLACLLLLLAPGHAALAGAAAPAPLSMETWRATAPLSQEEEESCGRGKATKEFGWKVVDFGVSTLKYLIGLFIIPVGFFLVIVGALLQMVEAVAC